MGKVANRLITRRFLMVMYGQNAVRPVRQHNGIRIRVCVCIGINAMPRNGDGSANQPIESCCW